MNESTPRALLLEDEAQIRGFVRIALEAEGCRVVEAATLAAGLAEAAKTEPDLAVVDLGLPDGDGIDYIRAQRTWSRSPILILSARIDEHDKIDALDAGADDYLTKPFGVGELRARIRALLRRRQRPAAPASPIVEFGKVSIDLPKRQVTRNGERVHVTPIEYRLLTMLVAHPGQVLTQRRLLREIWGPEYVDSSHYLRVFVGRLRQKLEDDPTQPAHIVTETGVGYRFIP
ncbi:MAG: two-component system response regulator KdpE [Betaproteobacteria bacterium]|nr:MAG: two-component system response regulator KdpE [Betaproteobacteria bacterium]